MRSPASDPTSRDDGSVSPWRRLKICLFVVFGVPATIAAFLAVVQGAAPSHAGDARPPLLVHDMDFPREPAGIVVLAWSPDSRHIAYVKWTQGEIAIADVATGVVTVIPNFEMNDIGSLAWSPDGKLLAVNSFSELKILRTDTFQVTHSIDLYPKLPDGRYIRFSHSAFSTDEKTLLIENSAKAGSDVVLWRFDLTTDEVQPLLKRPPLGKKVYEEPLAGRFLRDKGRLYYSTMFRRGDDGIVPPPLIIDRADRSMRLLPSTCFVFDFSGDLDRPGVRRMDFPPLGQKPRDESKYPLRCNYSPASNRFLAYRHVPFFMNGAPAVPVLAPGLMAEAFFTSHVLSDDALSPSFGMKPAVEEGQFGINLFELHPRKPWLVTVADPASGELLTVWNIVSGQALARIRPLQSPAQDLLNSPHISPDGAHVAFVTRNNILSIYRFSHF